MIRSFIALPLEQSVRTRLSTLGRTIPGARVVPENQIHLTLRFLGDIESSRLGAIKEGLTQVNAAPVTVTISGVGHFPPRGMPRVIWAGVTPPAAINGLRTKINFVLKELGLPPEERNYHPHITIARLKNCPLGRIADFLTSNSLLQSPPLTIETFTLFSSTLSAKGALHHREADYPLLRPQQ